MELDWYLPDPRGIEAKGPFSTDSILDRIKEGTLSFDSFVCCPQLKGEKWHRIYEFDEFKTLMESRPICRPPKSFSKGIHQKPVVSGQAESADSVSGLKDDAMEIEGEVIIHNNSDHYKGKCILISNKSITISLNDSPELRVGSEFYLTLYGATVKTFTSVVALLSRKSEGSLTVYELYFLRINPASRRNVEDALVGAVSR